MRLVTNGTGTQNPRRKGGKKGPYATVKFGSASVPIYRTESNGRVRFILTHYRDGKRLRQAFTDQAAAKKEAKFVAQRIQRGMQHVTDLKPRERDNYKKAVELLDALGIPLVAAVEDYVQGRGRIIASCDGQRKEHWLRKTEITPSRPGRTPCLRAGVVGKHVGVKRMATFSQVSVSMRRLPPAWAVGACAVLQSDYFRKNPADPGAITFSARDPR
jgi:hypothetical protein